MSHLDYYRYQAQARGMHSVEDVRRGTAERGFVFDRIVLPWLPADRSQPIAELACGHGGFLWWLKLQNFTDLRGVDSSEPQVQLARQVGANVDMEDVNHWLARQPRNQFAALVAIDLIEHLSKDDCMTLLQSTYAALEPGGSLILRLPNGDSPFVGMNLFNDITHVWTYTPNCLNSLAAMQGYSRTEFADEGAEVIRDMRWLKLPFARLSAAVLRVLIRGATRERVQYLSPHLWARLIK